jgi:hypothetical protein
MRRRGPQGKAAENMIDAIARRMFSIVARMPAEKAGGCNFQNFGPP